MGSFYYRTVISALLALVLLFCLSACGSQNSGEAASSEAASAKNPVGSFTEPASGALSKNSLPDDSGIQSLLAYSNTLALDYAERFRVFLYQGGYSLICLCDGTRFLVLPEGKTAPSGLPEDITVLKQPVENIYLAGSACMDMFIKMGALDSISLSGTDINKWYLPEAREAMADGRILYAGKYSIPDYELILSRGCSLAIENTMILHTPEVREQLVKTGIPVLIDHSSYEPHPLGRTEWVKLYGILTGHEKEAMEAFEQQKAAFKTAASGEKSGRSMAFFSIRPNGSVTVRKSSDYVPSMIQLAGGTYLPDSLDDGSITSTTTLQMEEFCRQAGNADCLIYNGTIEGEIRSINELLNKAPVLKIFPAIKNGHVWYTEQNLYQSSMESGLILSDFHKILMNPDSSGDDLQYLKKMKKD